jgi:hypothetical protein
MGWRRCQNGFMQTLAVRAGLLPGRAPSGVVSPPLVRITLSASDIAPPHTRRQMRQFLPDHHLGRLGEPLEATAARGAKMRGLNPLLRWPFEPSRLFIPRMATLCEEAGGFGDGEGARADAVKNRSGVIDRA